MKKKIFAVMLAVSTICCNAFAGGFPEFGKAVEIGSPVKSTQVIHAAFGKLNGDDIMYTSVSGAPAILNVYNLDKNKLISSHSLTGTKNIWYHNINTDGKVYICSAGNLFSYSPADGVFENLGKLPGDTGDSFVNTHDEYGNIYIATTKHAQIIKYDIRSKTFTDMGSVVEGATYVRSINYIDGYLYCGVKGDSLVGLYKVKADNPQIKERIPLPLDGDYTSEVVNSATWVYTGTVIGKKLALYVHTPKIYILLLYDTESDRFLKTGFKSSFKGLYVSPERNGKSYFLSGAYLYSLDLATGKAQKLNLYTGTDTFHGVGWVDFNGENGLYGEFLAVVNTNSGQTVYYDVDKLRRYESPVEITLQYAGFTLQSIERGDRENGDNSIYIGSYAGNQSARYDLDTGIITNFPSAQIEGMTCLDGVQYLGTYTKANIYSYEHGKDTAPVHLGRIGLDQDRPFAMTAGDGKVYAGTVPDYGLSGGVIAEYDTVSGKLESHGKIIENQSIIGLVYKDGLLYGSTTVWGGLGASVKAEKAVIFIYDPINKKLLKSFTPTINGCDKPLWIGGLAFDKNGKLWAASGNSVFIVNTEKMCVEKEINFLDYTYSTTNHQWRPLYIRFDSKGRLYVNINSIQVVDVDTFEHISLLKNLRYKIHMYELDQYGNIYYALSDKLNKLPAVIPSKELFIGKKPEGISGESNGAEFVKTYGSGYILKPGVKYTAVAGTVPAFEGKALTEYGIMCNGKKYKSGAPLSDNRFIILFSGAKKDYPLYTYAVYTDATGSKTVLSDSAVIIRED